MPIFSEKMQHISVMHVQYLTEILTTQAQFVSASYGLALQKETSWSNAFVFFPAKRFSTIFGVFPTILC